MLPLRWAGALPISQSPMNADGGAVMETIMARAVHKALVNIAHIQEELTCR